MAVHYGANQGKCGQNGENKVIIRVVLFDLFISQIVQYYKADSVLTNFAYLGSLHTLKISTKVCFPNLPWITEEKDIFLLKG